MNPETKKPPITGTILLHLGTSLITTLLVTGTIALFSRGKPSEPPSRPVKKPAEVAQGPVSLEAEKLVASMNDLKGWRVGRDGYLTIVNDAAQMYVDHQGVLYHWKDGESRPTRIYMSHNDCTYIADHFRDVRNKLMVRRLAEPSTEAAKVIEPCTD
jgi:hypothetical protein